MTATRATSKRSTAARERVKDLVAKRRELARVDDQLDKAIGQAYKAGVSAIELAKLTGLTRTNIYDRLQRVEVEMRQYPKKVTG